MNDKLEQLLAMSICKSLKLIHSKGLKEGFQKFQKHATKVYEVVLFDI